MQRLSRVERWHRASLRRTLTVALSAGMLVVLAAEGLLAWRTAVDASNAAYDRSLLGAIKAIDANISTESGGLGVELPYRMLEFFELTASGTVYFRVGTEDGLVTIGDAALPPPADPLATGRPQFRDTVYYGTPVRMASYARVLDRPVAGQAVPQRVVVQVAEARTSREQFTSTLVLQAMVRDLALVLVALLLMTVAVGWALRPLARLRSEVTARPPEDLTPIEAPDIPADVRPLVAAINIHVDHIRRLVTARRQFVDDASHQLRTLLATLTTQVTVALRQQDPQAIREVLHALKDQLDETVRRTNQMLALARADSVELAPENLDLTAFAREVTRGCWREAGQRGIDLGFDADDAIVTVRAHRSLLREALSNLLHNALRHVPSGGHVTVRVDVAGDEARLTVIDDGPGIPAAERARVGERFFRASNTVGSGSGLGLAIARALAERHHGRLEVDTGPGGVGLAVTIVLPLAVTGELASTGAMDAN
jgi:two-component system sensor histidine kinase TctE